MHSGVLEIFRALDFIGNTFKKVIQTGEWINTITSGSVSGISKTRCACKVNKGQMFILVPTLKQNATSISSHNWFQPDLSLSLSPPRKKALCQSITYLHSYSATYFRCTDGHQRRWKWQGQVSSWKTPQGKSQLCYLKAHTAVFSWRPAPCRIKWLLLGYKYDSILHIMWMYTI